MNGLQFLRPAWLLLLPVAGWLWWRVRLARDPLRGWKGQMDRELLEALRMGGETPLSGAGWMSLAAAGLTVLSLAGPVFRLAPSPFAEDDAVLVVILNSSAGIEDAPPEPSALVQAQMKIRDLIRERADGKTALIAYAGTAHLVLPATTDGEVLADMAREISPGVLPVAGDDLPAALRRAGELLTGDHAASGSILVLAAECEAAPESVEAAWDAAGRPPVQVLSLRDPVDVGLSAAARRIKAPLETLTADTSDVQAITRRAARQVRSVEAGEGAQWQEDGWWLVVPVSALVLLGFRREDEG